MMHIGAMNLAGVDLNLLTVFEALLSERHVTRAARRVGLAQPSVSNALARLRALFDDPLFVRAPGGMRPTPRAEALAPHVAAALAAVRAALETGRGFAPATARRAFRLAAADYTEVVLLPGLLARLGAEAPGVDLRVRPLGPGWAEEFDRGGLDAAVGVFPNLPKRFRRQRLLTEEFVGIARAGRVPEGLAAFCAARHVLVSQQGADAGAADAALAAIGQRRRIAVTVTGFQSLAQTVAAADLVAVTARRLAARMAAMLPLALFPLPMPMPGFALDLVLGPGAGAAEAWFGEVLAEVAAAC